MKRIRYDSKTNTMSVAIVGLLGLMYVMFAVWRSDSNIKIPYYRHSLDAQIEVSPKVSTQFIALIADGDRLYFQPESTKPRKSGHAKWVIGEEDPTSEIILINRAELFTSGSNRTITVEYYNQQWKYEKTCHVPQGARYAVLHLSGNAFFASFTNRLPIRQTADSITYRPIDDPSTLEVQSINPNEVVIPV